MRIDTETHSPEETGRLGSALAKLLRPGDIISLTGDLGAGKNRFTQGLAGGLGIADHVTSPTFALIKEYDAGRLPLYHFDMYRLESPRELESLGYEDYFFGTGVAVIEWGDKAAGYLPEATLTIDFRRPGPGEGDTSRTIQFDYKDIRWQAVVEAALR